jgi:hypothetical protein
MLNIAFGFVAVAASLGAYLALGFMREGRAAKPAAGGVPAGLRGLGLIHGSLGGAGLLVLVAALRAGEVRPAVGFAGFGQVAAWLLGIALLFGLVILGMAQARRGRVSLLLAAHATLAIAGVVVLLALVLG